LTRNISFQGIAVVLPAELTVGHPIEVLIDLPDPGPTHLAGVVAFCRRVAGAYYEVGVEIRSSASAPILQDDPSAMANALPWFAEAHAALRPR
ncbi:MAG: PilZ domain-containing protein, partial [Planctomycetota bacterium]